LISWINDDLLYQKLIAEGVPFYKWWPWLEVFLQKSVFSELLKKKDSKKSFITNKSTISPPKEKRKRP
jgi:hypothetical protein